MFFLTIGTKQIDFLGEFVKWWFSFELWTAAGPLWQCRVKSKQWRFDGMALVCMIVLQEGGEEHCPAAFISIMTTFFLCKMMGQNNAKPVFRFFFCHFFVLSMLVNVQLFAFV